MDGYFFHKTQVWWSYRFIQGWIQATTLATTLMITMHTNSLFICGSLRMWHMALFGF
jgi:hypothetical protein